MKRRSFVKLEKISIMANIQKKTKKDTKLRIFHGFSAAAGNAWVISREQRKQGLIADHYRLGGNIYQYKADYDIHRLNIDEASSLLNKVSDQYDVFHFYYRSFYFEQPFLEFPSCLDMLALRAAGKIVIMNFRGSEVRKHSLFKKLSPFNYVDENPSNLVRKFPEKLQEKLIQFSSVVAHKVIVPDPELQSYCPGSIIVPRAINLSEWKCVGLKNKENPLILHAPSRRVVKGTDAILQAVEELKEEGLTFRFELVENLDNKQAKELYKKSDIIIDQLRIGWYGVLAVEAMALGKVVVSFIRDDLLKHFDKANPIAVADPLSIKNTLRELITNISLREKLSKAGREYCEQVHDSVKIAKDLKNIYKAEMGAIKPIDASNLHHVINFLNYQKKHKRLLSSIYGKLINLWTYVLIIKEKGLPYLWKMAKQRINFFLQAKTR